MKIHKFRSILYKLGKFLGDIQAISSGSPKKLAKRAGRRIVGRAAGKGIRRLFK